LTATPRSLGFRWPAEWERHAATWLSWPHKRASWPGKFEPIPAIFVEVVRALAGGEEVSINARAGADAARIREELAASGVPLERVRLIPIPTDDAWCRDHGPTFVVRDAAAGRELALVDWKYNAWGGKYPPFELDDRVPARIAELLDVPRFEPGIVMEGGALDTDGLGTVLTTEACLLNPNRNPHLSRREIEQALADYLGARRVLWLGDGIDGDDTDGHVDDLARFVAPATVVAVVEEDPADVNFRPLRDNLARLASMRDAEGRKLEVVPLPMPPPAYHEGQRLPASYANFYVANDVVLVPTYAAEADGRALATLARLFPGRRVVGIDCRDLVWGLGALHCITQQQPAVRA
jgi:agmatine deiminase